MKTGLVLEGGALRTIFSSGVCDAFLNEKLPMPDYTIGVSAGIAYGVSYLSRQKRRNLQLLMHYANDRRYMGWGNFFDPRNRSYFGLKFAYDTIPNELVPFDYDTFEAYPGQVEAVVTNLDTGKAEYFPVERRDDRFKLLQAGPSTGRSPGGTPASSCSRPHAPCPCCSSPSGWMTAPPIWTGAAPTPFPGSGRWR